MGRLRILWLAIAPLLVGCYASSVRLSEGVYSITCKRNRGNCYEEAALDCPRGFIVRDGADQHGAVAFGNTSGSVYGNTLSTQSTAFVVPTYSGDMLIECRDHVSDEQVATTASVKTALSESDEQLQAIKANPRYPELGATAVESGHVCVKERGVQIGKRATAEPGRLCVCTVAGAVVYEAFIPKGAQTITAAKVFYEDGEFPDARRKLQKTLGPGEPGEILHGHRSWVWDSAGVELRSYANGVWVTYRTVVEVDAGVSSSGVPGAD